MHWWGLTVLKCMGVDICMHRWNSTVLNWVTPTSAYPDPVQGSQTLPLATCTQWNSSAASNWVHAQSGKVQQPRTGYMHTVGRTVQQSQTGYMHAVGQQTGYMHRVGKFGSLELGICTQWDSSAASNWKLGTCMQWDSSAASNWVHAHSGDNLANKCERTN